MVEIYEVGGAVRDGFIGVKNKDVDYAVEANSYSDMVSWIIYNGGQIYLEKPEYFTVRARVKNIDADFVLCRKDGEYADGRHPESVTVGSIYDDLARRDFTMNAIARNVRTGEIIDPHSGVEDIRRKFIRCVGDCNDRFQEDSLRILRALRFSITKNFFMDLEISNTFESIYWMNRLSLVSEERIREEITKMFSYNTPYCIRYFGSRPLLADACFGNNIWLKPTSEAVHK